MKRARNLGEGWLIAAALLAALALCVWTNRPPRMQSVAPVHSVDAQALARSGQTDLNAASARELEALPGIGPALAEAIVQYREEHGPFASVDALDDVPGIGAATLEGLRPYIRLE